MTIQQVLSDTCFSEGSPTNENYSIEVCISQAKNFDTATFSHNQRPCIFNCPQTIDHSSYSMVLWVERRIHRWLTLYILAIPISILNKLSLLLQRIFLMYITFLWLESRQL